MSFDPQNDSLYMTISLIFKYVDAAVNDIESWYIDRFQNSLHEAQNDHNTTIEFAVKRHEKQTKTHV